MCYIKYKEYKILTNVYDCIFYMFDITWKKSICMYVILL